MLRSNQWSVFVYTLVLITLSISMAMIVVTNVSILNNTFSDSQLWENLDKWLEKQFQHIKKRSDFFNSDWGGFVDNFWCPNNLVMSGATTRTTGINSNYFASGSQITCRADFGWENLDLIFDSDFTTFESANLWGSDLVTLNWEYSKTANGKFSDSDATLLSFDSSYYTADGIDDNFNSDDFTSQNSTGSQYITGILDNDANAKILVSGVINNNDTWKNIFWNNSKIADYIDQNSNNVITQTPNLSNASGSLFFETDTPVELRVTEFRKSDFDQYGDLVPIDKNEFSISTSWSGFLQDNGTLSATISGNEFEFDFINKNYAIFLKNTQANVVIYNYYFENSQWQKIIILPVQDDKNDVFSWLWYNMIINSSGRYIYKLQEMFTSK